MKTLWGLIYKGRKRDSVRAVVCRIWTVPDVGRRSQATNLEELGELGQNEK